MTKIKRLMTWIYFTSPNYHHHMFRSRVVFGRVGTRTQFVVGPRVLGSKRYYSFGFGKREVR